MTGQPPADPFQLAEWNALAEECFIAGCTSTDIDQRGPVRLRGGGMRKACVEHWEGVFRVLGAEACWESGDAYRPVSHLEVPA